MGDAMNRIRAFCIDHTDQRWPLVGLYSAAAGRNNEPGAQRNAAPLDGIGKSTSATSSRIAVLKTWLSRPDWQEVIGSGLLLIVRAGLAAAATWLGFGGS